MGIVNHPIVGDRVIEGSGTTAKTWQQWDGLKALPRFNIEKLVKPGQRVCIFAPHPDDEILGCAGLMQHLAALGHPIALMSVTNGTQSHPNSALYTPQQLDIIRPQETQAALHSLGIAHQVERIPLTLTDGAVYQQQAAFKAKLHDILRPDDIVVTTFIHDGHPDHEATGQVVQRFAAKQQLTCWQVLIWAWHWAIPNDSRIPWHLAQRLDLTPTQQALKIQAINCFKSQIEPDTTTGQAPILSQQTIERITQPWEVYLHEPNAVF